MATERVYFPNLNGLRFIAALLVIVHHVEQFKTLLHIKSRWTHSPFVEVIGKLGVVLFFVLSGFLITYLLLVEERNSGTIRVGRFYLRRALRIWPLYFLTVALGLGVYPHLSINPLAGLAERVLLARVGLFWTLYLSFLPNLAVAWLGVVPYVSHTWSIGTEEQFYVLWPLVLSAGRRFRPVLIVSVGLVCLGAGFAVSSDLDTFAFKRVAAGFLSLFNIDCMAVGGFVALLAFGNSRHLRWLRSAPVFYSTVVLVLVLIGKGVRFRLLHYEIYSILFAILILNLATRPGAGRGLENGVMRYLGTISYGLYMYHPICIVTAMVVVRQAGLTSDFVLYPLALGLVVSVAALSYRFFEAPFLKAKTRFAVVASGDPGFAALAPLDAKLGGSRPNAQSLPAS